MKYKTKGYLVNCIIDPLAFVFDGKPGDFSRFVLFSVNTVLFLYNLAVGFGVVFLVSYHLHRKITAPQKIVVGFMVAAEAALLTLNIFTPVVFSIDSNNFYHREKFYMVYRQKRVL